MSLLEDQESTETTERAVLFAAMHDTGMCAELMVQANVDWFLVGMHRQLFTALKSCFDDDIQADVATVFRRARVQANAQFGDDVLQAEWIAAGKTEVKGMTVATFTEEHLPFLVESYRVRKLHEFFSDGIERTANAGESAQLLAWASAQIESISSLGSNNTAIKISEALLDQYSRPRTDESDVSRNGPFTRMNSFDSVGFRLNPHEPTTIAGKPGHGKTIISSQIAIGASTQCCVAMLPVEDGDETWIKRYAMMTQNRTVDAILDLDVDHKAHSDFTGYCYRIKDRPLYIAKNCIGMTSFDAIAFLQRLKAQDPTLGLAIIDQVFRLGDYGRREIKGETQTEAITRQLTRLATACASMRICLVMLQHVKKDIVGYPQVSDISDSYVFERLSRKILLVHRPNYSTANDDCVVNVNFAKSTMGARHNLDLEFNGKKLQIDGFVDPVLRSPYA